MDDFGLGRQLQGHDAVGVSAKPYGRTGYASSHARSFSDNLDHLQFAKDFYWPSIYSDLGTPSSLSDTASTDPCSFSERNQDYVDSTIGEMNRDKAMLEVAATRYPATTGYTYNLSLTPKSGCQSDAQRQAKMSSSLGTEDVGVLSKNDHESYEAYDPQFCAYQAGHSGPFSDIFPATVQYGLKGYPLHANEYSSQFVGGATSQAAARLSLPNFKTHSCNWSLAREGLHRIGDLEQHSQDSTALEYTYSDCDREYHDSDNTAISTVLSSSQHSNENSIDGSTKFHQQPLRSSDDLYTPRYIRGSGADREGWCDICQPGRWLVLKNSAYWYDKTFSHGISHHTGRLFASPVAIRSGSRLRPRGRALTTGDLCEYPTGDISTNHQKVCNPGKDRGGRQGLCGSCNQWVSLGNGKRTKGFGMSWYRHAYKCQSKVRSAEKTNPSVSYRGTQVLTATDNWKPNFESFNSLYMHSS